MKTILLKFSGPLQSWGTNSHFEIRHTDPHPSKSAVLGLIAAALGWRRNDQRIETLNRIVFAVRVDQPGSILKDYHTAHKIEVKKGKINFRQKHTTVKYGLNELDEFSTYVTTRYYLTDAVFVVALGVAEESDADKIVEALRAPYFQPYMGRRALPLPVDFLLGTVDGDPLSALQCFPWQAADWYKRQEQKKGNDDKRLSVFAERAVHGSVAKTRRDHILSLDTSGRRYLVRMEYETVHEISVLKEEPEHDAFDAVGGV